MGLVFDLANAALFFPRRPFPPHSTCVNVARQPFFMVIPPFTGFKRPNCCYVEYWSACTYKVQRAHNTCYRCSPSLWYLLVTIYTALLSYFTDKYEYLYLYFLFAPACLSLYLYMDFIPSILSRYFSILKVNTFRNAPMKYRAVHINLYNFNEI